MVKLYFDGFWIDLTKWVDMGSISIRKTGDKTLDSASFTIPQIEHLAGLDVSRPFPRLARVTIQDDEFILQTDTISDLGGFYSHDIELVSVAKLMADTTTAGLTVTQPSGDKGLYYRSFGVNDYLRFTTYNKIPVALTTIEQSEDTTDIENQTMKKDKKYNIQFKGTFFTEAWAQFESSNQVKITVFIEVNGVVVEKRDVYVKRQWHFIVPVGKLEKKIIDIFAEYENTGINEVKIYVQGNADDQIFDFSFEDLKLSISSNEYPAVEKITLDYVVEKILHNHANKQRFYLSDNSKAILKGHYSYEWTLAPSYLWLQLTQVADYIKAFPTARFGETYTRKWSFLGRFQSSQPYSVGMRIRTNIILRNEEDVMRFMEDYAPNYADGFIVMIQDSVSLSYVKVVEQYYADKVIVDIIPFDDLAQEYIPIGVSDSGAQATIDDYAASIEINADNVYSEENQITEITTLRSSGDITQINYDDIVIPTMFPIGDVVALKVRIPAAITVGGLSKTQGDWIDIDIDRVLPQEYYNTLESMSTYTGVGRFAYSKNNCLYFKQGEKNVHGLAYLGLTTKSMMSVTTYIRGIYEVIIAQLTRDNGDSGVDFEDTFDNGTVTRDNEIAVEITYRPYTETNAVVYKSDQTGFEFTTSKFLNETATLNSPDIIGAYTQGIADRSGGTVHSFNGICRYDELPSILSTWGDLVLFAVSYSFIDWETVEYQLQYIKDYVFISSYESYNPKVRVYEIPKDTIIDRVIKKNVHIVFDKVESIGTYNINRFIGHLGGVTTKYTPTLAELTHDTKRTLVPCVSQAVGRVVEFRVSMKDNYSAGLIKYTHETFTYQKDYPYTNAFGRVNNTKVNYRLGFLYQPTVTVLNALPSADLVPYLANSVGIIELEERKDARERSIYSLQFNYLSQNNAIIIYDGIAKFSNVVAQGKGRAIKWVEVSKLPNRHKRELDTDTIIRDATVVLNDTQIEIVTIGINPVVCYDQQSGELLLGDNRKTTTRTIYIKGVEQ